MGVSFDTLGVMTLANSQRSYKLELHVGDERVVAYVGLKAALDVLQKRKKTATVWKPKNTGR